MEIATLVDSHTPIDDVEFLFDIAMAPDETIRRIDGFAAELAATALTSTIGRGDPVESDIAIVAFGRVISVMLGMEFEPQLSLTDWLAIYARNLGIDPNAFLALDIDDAMQVNFLAVNGGLPALEAMSVVTGIDAGRMN